MKRYLVALTESELAHLRRAIRTASKEDCGRQIAGQYDRLLNRVINAQVVTLADWRAYETAAGEIIEAGDTIDHASAGIKIKACNRFSTAIHRLFVKR